ncbi:MAG TPA: hypothetical protein VH397_08560 [Xanthobacteraceae bacterium]|jgi:hypothetical protein
MTTNDCLASLGTVALLALSLASASAASADDCQLQMGPYTSQSAADLAVRQAKSIGYNTSGVWGEGGIVSQISNRRYFFNVLFAC